MATASVYLDKRRELKDGKYPIQIRVSHKRARKYYRTGYHATEDQLRSILDRNVNVRGVNKIVREKLDKDIEKAELIIASMTVFSFTHFGEKFLSEAEDHKYDVLLSMKAYTEGLDKQSTIEGYLSAVKSFKSYLKSIGKNEELHYGDVSPKWLNAYEQWMLDNNKSWSTIGIYTKYMRRVFNRAIVKGIITRDEFYPFGKYGDDKYVIPSEANVKRALTFEQINKIYHYRCTGETPMKQWRDIWIFSYLANGMNLKDIANLKWKDYNRGKISFERQKTRMSTKSEKKRIVIPLPAPAKKILLKYGTKGKDKDSYIFPFYDNTMDEKRKHDTARQILKNIRKWVNRIGEDLGFEEKVNFQSARHSFATISRNAGVDIEYISKALGHNSLKTTDKYLDSFEEKKIRENQSHLLDANPKTYLKVV